MLSRIHKPYLLRPGREIINLTIVSSLLAKQFLKKKAATLKLSAFDLLRQNISVNRNISDLFIEDVKTNVLTQYFMLSFTYNINRFGGNAGRQGRNMWKGLR